MKFLSGILLVVFAAVSLIVIAPEISYAQDPLNDVCVGEAANSATCQGRTVNNPVAFLLLRAIQIIILVTGVASVIVIIISGFRYVLSSGDSNTVNSAKNAILFAVIGLVIAISGQLILSFVLGRLNI